MKIYFAGSIRGGREDKELYLEIIRKLSSFGDVLTEHIGNTDLSSYGETRLSDEDIYLRDIQWLTSSDAVIAEVTTASLGVGYEIGIAKDLGKKILCIYREQEGKRISAMIAGNKKISAKAYKDLSDLDKIFGEFFA